VGLTRPPQRQIAYLEDHRLGTTPPSHWAKTPVLTTVRSNDLANPRDPHTESTQLYGFPRLTGFVVREDRRHHDDAGFAEGFPAAECHGSGRPEMEEIVGPLSVARIVGRAPSHESRRCRVRASTTASDSGRFGEVVPCGNNQSGNPVMRLASGR